MNGFYIEAYGCSRRLLDAERIREYMRVNGWRGVDTPATAQCIIVVTCGLTRTVTEECLRRIGCLQGYKGRLLVYGCLPAMFPEQCKHIPAENIVVTKDIRSIEVLFPDFPVKFSQVADANFVGAGLGARQGIRQFLRRQAGRAAKVKDFLLGEYCAPWPVAERLRKITADVGRLRKGVIEGVFGGIGFDPSLASVRVSEGCLGQCSYCGIQRAIGRTRSKPLADIREELKRLIARKRYRVNLCSSDLGAYGLDAEANLIVLLREILAFDARIRLAFVQDLNPLWACRYKEGLIELAATRRIEGILMPVQSGSRRILGLMRREFDLEEFKRLVHALRKASPALRIKTQVIVGFPSESEDDFARTVAYLKECSFDQVDAFAYYEVAHTPAESIVPKLPAEEIKKRLKALVRLLPPATIKAVSF